jgi:hypothetical protein
VNSYYYCCARFFNDDIDPLINVDIHLCYIKEILDQSGGTLRYNGIPVSAYCDIASLNLLQIPLVIILLIALAFQL